MIRRLIVRWLLPALREAGFEPARAATPNAERVAANLSVLMRHSREKAEAQTRAAAQDGGLNGGAA